MRCRRGYTLTPALKNAIDGASATHPRHSQRNSALRRWWSPSKLPACVVFLASSDAASAMTGANVPVDCGWLVVGSWQHVRWAAGGERLASHA